MADQEKYIVKNGIDYIRSSTALSIIDKPSLNNWRGQVGNHEANSVLEKSIIRGNAIHDCNEMIAKGEGLEIDLENELAYIKNEVEAFKYWFFENVQEVICIEKRYFSKKYLYTGKPDLVAVLKGRKIPDLIDYKSGRKLDKTMDYAQSSYKELLKENGVIVNNRIILHFRDGLKEVPLDNTTHNESFRMFLYAMELYRGYNNK